MLALSVDFRWWILLHVIGAFGFVMAHGVAVSVALRLRKERDRARIAELLQFSGSSVLWMYVWLGVLLLGGITSGFKLHVWGFGWIWTALAVLIAMIGEMSAVARPYYQKVKEAVQLRPSGVPRKSDEELEVLLRSPVALVNAVIGFGALVFILWLMIFTPY
jgi:Na+-transporting methylmalonyl-CoA/oxaloacetate decarboxylase gamma subunit